MLLRPRCLSGAAFLGGSERRTLAVAAGRASRPEARAARRPRTRRSSRVPPRSGVGVARSAPSTAASSRAASSGAVEAVGEHERRRAEHGRRVGDALAGDVGRRAVHGLEDARAARRRGWPRRRGRGRRSSPAATSERMSPKVFSVRRTSKRSGAITSCMAAVVDEHVLELDVRVVGVHALDDLPPDPRGVEHVRLVHGGDVPAPRARELEAAPRDALDLVGPVLHRVEDGAVVADAAGAVVEAADQLADDEQVDAVAAGGAEVRVDVELAAQPDEALLGPDGCAVELGARRPRP